MPVSADLGETLETYVNALVKSGRYHSKSEVLREGIRLLQERETQLQALDAALAEGLADVERGELHPAKQVFAELHAEIEAIKAKSENAG